MCFDMTFMAAILAARSLKWQAPQRIKQFRLTPVPRSEVVLQHTAALAPTGCGECPASSLFDHLQVLALMVDPGRQVVHEWPVRAETSGR